MLHQSERDVQWRCSQFTQANQLGQHHKHIETYSAEVFDSLAKDRFLRGLPRDRFVERLTHYFAEVNAIHAFREGNGRTQRAFFRQLAEHDRTVQ